MFRSQADHPAREPEQNMGRSYRRRGYHDHCKCAHCTVSHPVLHYGRDNTRSAHRHHWLLRRCLRFRHQAGRGGQGCKHVSAWAWRHARSRRQSDDHCPALLSSDVFLRLHAGRLGMIYYILRALFHVLLIRPFMYVWVGLNVKHGGRLPQNGPAIIVSNHNSHLDTLTLEILFPLRFLRKIRPVAAADYFLRNRILKWFTVDVMRIIPVERRGKGGADPLAPCHEALARGHVLIIYPEGSRGEPGKMAE